VAAHDRDTRSLSLPFGAVVFVALAACVIVTARLFDSPARSLVSLLCQHAGIVAAFVVLAAFARSAVLRVALFATLVAYVLAIEAHTLSMALFSVPADAVIYILANGNDPAGVLEQAHVAPRDMLTLASLVAAEIALLAFAYRRLPRLVCSDVTLRAATPVPLALAAIFVGEQALARKSDEYLMRHSVLPGYYRIFGAGLGKYTFPMPLPSPEARVDSVVEQVRGARNPKNIIFIVLESVRYDVIDPQLTPNLWALAKDSLFFTNAYSEATYTARVWNVLLLNRPAYMFFRDLEAFESGADASRSGAFPARVLKQAGYQILISMGCEFEWLGFQGRFMGDKGLVDRFFSSFPGNNKARHVSDDRATDEIVKWLGNSSMKEPFFILTQLDATHYRYFFHEEKALIRPYADALSPRQVTSQASLDLLFNRYKNSVYAVDSNIGRIVDAVRASGRYDDTAIVVISDHGEGFELGAVAHMQVNEVTKHVPLVMRLPGVTPARVNRLVTDGDIFPTLFEYLQVEGLDADVLLGHSARSSYERGSVLTLQGAMRQANLTFPLFTIVFDIGWIEDKVLTFSPTTILGRDGKPIPGWRDLIATVPWRSELKQNLRWAQAAEPLEARAPKDSSHPSS
jgi:glucan phosphoethanolaminetransferase (alkaline phosphatase superfamily)